jgi:hypothetical protein
MKKSVCFSILFLFCFLSVSAQDDKNISWQFALYNSEGSVIGSASPSEPLTVSDGSQFRLGLSCKTDAFCYIADEQPDGTVNVIFNGIVKNSASLNLPGENSFFTLQPPDGTERFHVIVSSARQKKLEKLFASSDKGSCTTTVSREIIDEIGRLRLTLAPYTEEPVKPAVMGATSRGFTPGSDSVVTAFSGASVYVETVRIRH